VVTTFLGAHAVPPEFKGNKGGYMDLLINEMLPLVRDTEVAKAADIFVEEGYFDADDARRLAKALPEGFRLRMHVDQFSTGGAELAAEIGATTADHLEQTNEKGIQQMADAGVIPVLLPTSVLCLGLEKYPDARRMLDLGMPVAVATDFNPGSAPSPSLPFAMSLAVAKMGISPLEALVGCTINAAKALGLSDVGVLATGAKADIAVWDAEKLDEVPYFVGAPLLSALYKEGVQVV
jgi:imidazolonepropionase